MEKEGSYVKSHARRDTKDTTYLVMAMFWRGTTTRGAVAGALVGLAASVVLVVLSKTVWVAVFHFPAAIFLTSIPRCLPCRLPSCSSVCSR